MKRAIVLIFILGGVLVWAGVSKPGPTGIEEPLPIEVNQPTEGLIKPVLVNVAKPWIITNDTGTHIVAYYQRVKMPDGTTRELKSRTPLTAVQWEAKAKTFWDAQAAAELNKPKSCTRCGGSGVEPQ